MRILLLLMHNLSFQGPWEIWEPQSMSVCIKKNILTQAGIILREQ